MTRFWREPDPTLRRLERDAAILAILMAAAALIAQHGRTDGALGVLAGGALMLLSYRAIRGGVDAMVARTLAKHDPGGVHPPVGHLSAAWSLTKFFARYGVIAIVAWAVLARLGAHPIGLFAGVSIPAAALAIEAVRIAAHTRRRRPGGGA
jgi:hypothetical protein